MSRKQTSDVYKGVYNFGVSLGKAWKKLAEADKTRFNSYKAKVMRLDSPNINVLSDTVRYMIQKIAETEDTLVKKDDKERVFFKHWDFPKIVTDTRARELFITGVYFGFFSPNKE